MTRPAKFDPFVEEVNGTIIGGDHRRYEFWTTEPYEPLYLSPYKFANGTFNNDEQAEAWCKRNYPDEYKQGVEMRCYD